MRAAKTCALFYEYMALYAPGQGPAKLTHALYGLGGISPTPTTLGAGRRAPVDWKAGDGFQETVMWTPAEAMNTKSFSDSHYRTLNCQVQRHCPEDDSMYECTCARQGTAFLTGKAMDQAVLAFLLECGTPFDVVETKVVTPS